MKQTFFRQKQSQERRPVANKEMPTHKKKRKFPKSEAIVEKNNNFMYNDEK